MIYKVTVTFTVITLLYHHYQTTLQYLPNRCSVCVKEDDYNLHNYMAGNWSQDPHGVFYSATSSSSSSLSLSSSGPPSTLLRKMSSFLFTIHHGATRIMLVSDVTSFNHSIKRLIIDSRFDGAAGLEFLKNHITTDSYHFMHTSEIHYENPCQYRLRKRMRPLFTIGIKCKGKLSKSNDKNKRKDESIAMIDTHAPPVFTSIPKFSVDSFSDSYFEYEGFWALFAAIFPPGNQTRKWGLWAQRMLKEIQGEMGVTSLSCPSYRSPSPITESVDATTTSMHAFIINWRCGFKMPFYECALLLATDLMEANFVDPIDVKLLRVWIQSLQNTGYPEPRRKSAAIRADNYFFGCVIYSPSANPSLQENDTRQNLFPNIYPLCKDLPNHNKVVYPFDEYSLTKKSRVSDIALVVIFFDSSIYSNIRYLHDLYKSYFPYIIYCGPDWQSFQVFYKTFQAPLTFIEVQNTRGFVAYECVSKAIMMNYDVNGYLEMADDVILNTWTLGNIPRDKFWFQKDLKIANRYQQIMHDFALPYPFPWWPWTVHGQMWGAKAMAKVWNRFERILRSRTRKRNVHVKKLIHDFLDKLRHNSGSEEHFFYCSSDIFYVPSKFRQEWRWLSELFFANNVFLDIAVPTLMNGLDSTGDIIRMEGIYLWYNERVNYPRYYKPFHQFFHPWKMGWIHRQDHANFLCYHVLPNIVTDRANTTAHISKSKREK